MKKQLLFKAKYPYDLTIRFHNKKSFTTITYNTHNGSIDFVINEDVFKILIKYHNDEFASEFFKECNNYLDIDFKFGFNDNYGPTISKLFRNIKIDKHALIKIEIKDETLTKYLPYFIQKTISDMHRYSMELTLIDNKEEE